MYVATVLGFVVGLAVNYALSLSFVFTQKKDRGEGLPVSQRAYSQEARPVNTYWFPKRLLCYCAISIWRSERLRISESNAAPISVTFLPRLSHFSW